METEVMSCSNSESLWLSLAEIKSETLSEIDSDAKSLGSSLSETESMTDKDCERLGDFDSDTLELWLDERFSESGSL